MENRNALKGQHKIAQWHRPGENWVILSYTNGFRERHFTHEPYFDCNSDSLSIGILTFYFLTIEDASREIIFTNYLKQYISTLKGNTINGIQYRFKEWLIPVLRNLFYAIVNEQLTKLLQLKTASGDVIQSGLKAFENWTIGKLITKKNQSNIATVTCFWGMETAYNTCEICGCKQFVFLLSSQKFPVCFDCYIGNSQSDTFRELLKVKYDASGQKIRRFTKYITPKREIVFFDYSEDRMIYMNGKAEIPMATEYLYRL